MCQTVTNKRISGKVVQISKHHLYEKITVPLVVAWYKWNPTYMKKSLSIEPYKYVLLSLNIWVLLSTLKLGEETTVI